MNIIVISMYIIFSLILFFLLNYMEERIKDNPINRVIIPLIYIILLSGLFKDNEFIFLVLIFEFLIRIFYTNYIEEKDFFKESSTHLKEYLITFILGYLLNAYFINQTESIFLSVSEFKIILWIFIIIFLYTLINNNLKQDLKKKTKKNEQRKKEYDIVSYAKLKNEYSKVVVTKYNQLIPLVYAIMIYHNSKKSKLYRKIDTIKFRLDNEPRKLGIMQIKSKKMITDEESIEQSIKKLEKLYIKYSKEEASKEDIIYTVLNHYEEEKEDIEQIMNIYNQIVEFNQK